MITNVRWQQKLRVPIRVALTILLVGLLIVACYLTGGTIAQPSQAMQGSRYWVVLECTWEGASIFNPCGFIFSKTLPQADQGMSVVQAIFNYTDDCPRFVQTQQDEEANAHMNDSVPPPPGYAWFSYADELYNHADAGAFTCSIEVEVPRNMPPGDYSIDYHVHESFNFQGVPMREYSVGVGNGFPITIVPNTGVATKPPLVVRPTFTISPSLITARSATVRYSLPRPGPVNITIFDELGRPVRTMQEMAEKDGVVRIDLSQVPAGKYLVKLEAGDWSETKKLVVQK